MKCATCKSETKRFGKHRNGLQRYRCVECGKTFTEAHEKPLGDMTVPTDKATLALQLLIEGTSVRATERITGLHRDTTLKPLVTAGEKCEKLMGRLIVNVPVKVVECDETWGFVQKKEGHKRPEEGRDESIGDAHTFVSIERNTKLVLNFALGRRSKATTDIFIEGLRAATAPGRFQITTDGFAPYVAAIVDTLGDRVDFAQLIKVYASPRDGEQRYSPAEVVDTEVVPVIGRPDPKRICTSIVERQNLTMRMQTRRLTRLTNGFSKKWENLWVALCLHFAYYNFCRIHRTLARHARHGSWNYRESLDHRGTAWMRGTDTLIEMNQLYYGDNLAVLRNEIPDESVDLVYLDPPFNSQATYNVLFRSTGGERSRAQIEAFEDTWHWGEEAERAFDEVMSSQNAEAAEMLRSMRSFLKENDMMAYLSMMAVRLLELHRVLKPTGSIYLHCDPTASHYLKILLDAIFESRFYRNELVWKRTSSHNDAAQGLTRYGKNHDIILFYSKSDAPTWNQQFVRYDDEYIRSHYGQVETGAGKRFTTSDLTAAKPGGDTSYEWHGVAPPRGRYWAYSRANMEKFENEGRLIYGRTGVPRLRNYLDEMPGVVLGSLWGDIPPINSQARERLGYPTQKPLALLERIITASSNEGGTVLDPFCGCGTAVHAAQKLKREWIGIDITHLAISLIEKRLKDAFPGIKYEVHGTPKDLDGARMLAAQDKYQFQWWAVSLVDAVPFGGKKKGADSGIDGLIYFKPEGKATEKAIVSVKGGENINVAMVRDLAHVVEREKAKIGVFITLADSTGPMRTEAVKTGFYETAYGKYPRIQILTIADLFAGKQPKIPLVDTASFKKAVREIEGGSQENFQF